MAVMAKKSYTITSIENNFIKFDEICINKNHILYFNENEIYLTNNTRIPISFEQYEKLLMEV